MNVYLKVFFLAPEPLLLKYKSILVRFKKKLSGIILFNLDGALNFFYFNLVRN